MAVVVDVSLRKKKETFLAAPENVNLHVFDKVIVRTEFGLEVGTVVSNEKIIEKPPKTVCKIIRKISPEDEKVIQENDQKAKEIKNIIIQKLEEYKLPIKISFIEYTFDKSRLLIYFTTESKVDLRNFLKDISNILQIKIQLFQIGVRDESQICGGIGDCGRELCCWKFIKCFTSITIEMIKNQDLAQTLTKLTGICGRLKCCLAFENDFYLQQRKKMPKLKSKVSTPDGQGIVVNINCLKEEVSIELPDGKISKYHLSLIK